MFKRFAVLSALAVMAGVSLAAAPAQAATPGATHYCYFNADHSDYTPVQIDLAADGYGRHRVDWEYLGSATGHSNGERIKEWQLVQQHQNSDGSFSKTGYGTDWTYSTPVTSDSNSVSTGAAPFILGNVYVWTWMYNADGRTCTVKWRAY